MQAALFALRLNELLGAPSLQILPEAELQPSSKKKVSPTIHAPTDKSGNRLPSTLVGRLQPKGPNALCTISSTGSSGATLRYSFVSSLITLHDFHEVITHKKLITVPTMATTILPVRSALISTAATQSPLTA